MVPAHRNAERKGITIQAVVTIRAPIVSTPRVVRVKSRAFGSCSTACLLGALPPEMQKPTRPAEKLLRSCRQEHLIRIEEEERMAGTTGLEPATSDVTGRRSNQLNYVPAMSRRCL